ncbi:MAG: His/Gly/Thr/Pro-type tRNA ligase C-terminal domain-containing protein, partial [Candidatus Aenigmatarchaeota archaeon]
VMAHGDDKGLILPPKVAPNQIVIVPIYYKSGEKKNVLKKAAGVKTKLEDGGFSVLVDDREGYTQGWKFNEWEMKGVQLRIEIVPSY